MKYLDLTGLQYYTTKMKAYVDSNAGLKTVAWGDVTGKPSFATVATTGSYNDLKNKPTAYSLPKASTTVLGGIKVGDGLQVEADGTLNCTIDPGSGTVSWGNISGKPSFAEVATTGSYNDLKDKPAIPTNYLPLTGGTLTGDLLASKSGDAKRAKFTNLEVSVYDSINTACKAMLSCTSTYGVVEVGHATNSNNVHIDANTGITFTGSGLGVKVASGAASNKLFASDGSLYTIESIKNTEIDSLFS